MDIRTLSRPSGNRQPQSTAVPEPKRQLLTRIVLPTAILGLTCSLLAYAARDAIRPARTVHVERVVTKPTESPTGNATTLTSAISVQAPGWVEPNPYPTYVTALTDGIIERLLVLEGDSVEAGQVIAEMIDDDAILAVTRAEAALARRTAQLVAAQTDWDNPVVSQRAVAVNKAICTQVKAELAQLNAMIAQQRARQKELQAEYGRVSKVQANAVALLEVEQAKFQLDAQRAMVEATEQQRPVLEAKLDQYEAELTAAETDLSLRVDQRRAVDEAEAAMRDAQAALDETKLRLTRMKIISPVQGVVINRMVTPGSKIGFRLDSPHSAHVAHLYDPNRLQVRVDVPLADAARVSVGQSTRIIVDVLPETQFNGCVTRFVHQADIGKNTVEVKVTIDDPSPHLKPDMLARVKFLAIGPTVSNGHLENHGLMIYAPSNAIQTNGEDQFVWTITSGNSRLRRQRVTLGSTQGNDWVAVLKGLNPGDVLVTDPADDLKEGQRIQIRKKPEPST